MTSLGRNAVDDPDDSPHRWCLTNSGFQSQEENVDFQASYQCNSTLRTAPFGRRTAATPFSFPHFFPRFVLLAFHRGLHLNCFQEVITRKAEFSITRGTG